jgi:hypothetical protein
MYNYPNHDGDKFLSHLLGAMRNTRSLTMASTENPVDAMVGASIEINGGKMFDPLGMYKYMYMRIH